MFFKKHFTKFLQKSFTTTEKTVNKEVEVIESSPVSEPSANNSADNLENQSLLGSSILFGKINNWNSGPDFVFENEAWAPGNEYVGLFRRRRAQVEEQTPSATEPNNQ